MRFWLARTRLWRSSYRAEKSNGIAAIPELLSTLAPAGCTVAIDAISAQTAIAEAMRNRGTDYVLAVKDNQPKLAESIEDFWRGFRAHPAVHTPRSFAETADKDRGRPGDTPLLRVRSTGLPR
jgi:predicted transposase YbfD/YdcC